MNFEKNIFQNSLEKPPEKSLDERWYERFKNIGAFQDTTYLIDKKEAREKEKDSFVSDKKENPDLNYPDLKKIDFIKQEKELLDLKKEILAEETDEMVRNVYHWKINEKLADLRMLKAAHERDDRRFSRYSQFIYGKPSKDVFAYTVKNIKPIIEAGLNSPLLDIRAAAQRLQDVLIKNSRINLEEDSKIPTLPLSKLAFLKKGKTIEAEKIRSAFEGALEIFQVQGFKVIVDKEGKYQKININQEKRTAIIPEDRKISEEKLKALMVHEIGTHAQRREKGEHSKLKLLGLGLDRYLKGEEGVSSYSEQQIVGASDYAGFDLHLAASLSTGIDGEKRDFRAVFEILKDYYFIRSKEKDKEAALKKSEASAWDICVRIFRGTTCKTPGACFTRDIVYREGNIGIWEIVKNNPEEARRFSVGKYDPTNSRHIWILDQLGISDADLEKLKD